MKIVSHTTKDSLKLARLADGLNEIALGAELRYIQPGEDVAAALRGAEIILTYRFEPEWWSGAHQLRWVHIGGAGVNHILFPELIASEVIVTNSRGIHTRTMAEYVLAAMLHFSQRFDRACEYKSNRKWRAAKIPMTRSSILLKDKKVGIIGAGAIGGGVGEMCGKLGMRVFAINRSKRVELPFAEITGGFEGIDKLMAWADFVVVTLPFTAETMGLIDARRIGLMKPGSYLINIARGGIVEETALIEALLHGRIAGAALDVFETEPLPDNSPLFEIPNLLLTPHIAGNYPEYTIDVIDLFLENLKRYLKGKPLKNIVDKNRGY